MPILELRLDRIRAVIDPEHGASLVSFTIDDPDAQPTPLMRPIAPGEADTGAMSMFLMAPWTNRIADARFPTAAGEHTLEPNFPDGSAIHGFVRDHPWAITDRTPLHAALEFDTRDLMTRGWPWPFVARVRYELEPGALVVDLGLTNLADEPMPFGFGFHPFFQRRLWSDPDDVRVRLPVGARYPCDRQIPTGPPAADQTTTDLAALAPLGDPGLDDVFTAAGPESVIEWPSSGVTLSITTSDLLDHLVVFTPRSGDGPQGWFCIEPVSMANDAFNLSARGTPGVGARTLAPAETASCSVRFGVTLP